MAIYRIGSPSFPLSPFPSPLPPQPFSTPLHLSLLPPRLSPHSPLPFCCVLLFFDVLLLFFYVFELVSYRLLIVFHRFVDVFYSFSYLLPTSPELAAARAITAGWDGRGGARDDRPYPRLFRNRYLLRRWPRCPRCFLGLENNWRTFRVLAFNFYFQANLPFIISEVSLVRSSSQCS